MKDTAEAYEISVTKIEGDRKIKFYSLFCEYQTDVNSKPVKVQVNCLNGADVPYMFWKFEEPEFYIFSEDKDDVPVDNEGCED